MGGDEIQLLWRKVENLEGRVNTLEQTNTRVVTVMEGIEDVLTDLKKSFKSHADALVGVTKQIDAWKNRAIGGVAVLGCLAGFAGFLVGILVH